MAAGERKPATRLAQARTLISFVFLLGCEAQLGNSEMSETPAGSEGPPGSEGQNGPDAVIGPDGTPLVPVEPGPVMGDTDGDGVADSPVACPPGIPQELILLSDLAFVNSVKALVGDTVVDGRLAPEAETKTFTQKGLVANTSLVSTRLDWAEHASEQLDGRVLEVTGCAADDTTCARTYLAEFMRKAYRRPVSDLEVDDLMTVFATGAETSFDVGVKLAVEAVILSPSFNHRTEYGTASADGTYQLTSHEIASSLSYLLTDSLPDDELARAADSGVLTNPVELLTQLDRLLEDEEVRDSVEKTVLSAWNLGNIFGQVKDPGLFPEFSAGLASQMYHETELFLKAHVWDPAKGLNSLLTSRSTFVNQNLANIYGVPFTGAEPSEFVATELPADQRSGILTQASFMTAFSRTDSTSVVARGLFVNGPLLCFPKIPAPPAEAIAAVEEQLAEDLTERERAEHRAMTSPCLNCHNQFDAFGLLLENYDPIGQFRTSEAGIPSDPGVEIMNKGSMDGHYEDIMTFAETAAQDKSFAQCLTRHMLVYATGEDGIARQDCEIFNATLDLAPEATLRDVIARVISADAFSKRIEETAQ